MSDFLPYLMAFVAIFLGWFQWIELSRGIKEAKAKRDAYAEALERLYRGMFVGGCNVHRQGPPCIDRVNPEQMMEPSKWICPPCWGRKLVASYRAGKDVDRILEGD